MKGPTQWTDGLRAINAADRRELTGHPGPEELLAYHAGELATDAKEELRDHLASIWRQRSDRYSEERTAALRQGRFVAAEKVEMFRIGG